MEDGEGEGGDADHPDMAMLDRYPVSLNPHSTYIPSRTRNSFSLCINGLPQPPAISGILQIWSASVPANKKDLLPTDRCTGSAP